MATYRSNPRKRNPVARHSKHKPGAGSHPDKTKYKRKQKHEINVLKAYHSTLQTVGEDME